MSEVYDAIVVGSGAGGGTAAYVMASRGMKVLVLERGRWYDSSDFSNDELKFGERKMIDQDPAVWPRSFRPSPAWGERTYTGRILPGSICVGGSTVHYCGVSFRAQPGDFAIRTIYGDLPGADLRDWPLRYEDLAPYYARVEEALGVAGDHEHPLAGPDGLLRPRARGPYPMPGVPAKYDGLMLERGAGRLGLHPMPTPLAINVRRMDEAHNTPYPVPGADGERPTCINCGHCCGHGCPNGAKGSTLVTMLPAVQARADCRIVPEAYVREILVSGGKATGVAYAVMDDDGNVHEAEAHAHTVVVACGAVETPTLCLRSPGLVRDGAAADLFGRYLTVHVYPGAVGWFTEKVNFQWGVWSTRCFDDWYWPDLTDPQVTFIKGGNVQNIGRTAGYPLSGPVGTAKMGPWGSPALQDALPEGLRAFGDMQRNFMEYFNDHLVVLGMVGEALPRHDNRVDADPSLRDAFGSPAPRITYDYHPMDIAMAEFYTPRLAAVLEAAGAFVTAGLSSTIPEQPPGGVHVHGSMRMGDSEDWSVTDPWGRVWGTENVYVADASLLTSSLGYNPALTVQALAWRTAEHIVEGGPS